MKPPHFVCVGAQKAGTTWLYDRLAEQPGVWVPPEKELHFFERACPNEALIGVEEQGRPGLLERYRPLLRHPSADTVRWIRRFHFAPVSTRWYRDLFPPELVGGRLAGDITPAYSTLDDRGVRFARRVLAPGCRVFLIVRNPVERVWSGIKMLHRWRGSSIEQVERENLRRQMEEPTHRLRGDYPRIVRLWGEAFGQDFAVFRYDRLAEDPAAFLREVGSFIGAELDPSRSELEARANADPAARRIPPALHELLVERFRGEIEELERLVPGTTAGWLEDAPVRG